MSFINNYLCFVTYVTFEYERRILYKCVNFPHAKACGVAECFCHTGLSFGQFPNITENLSVTQRNNNICLHFGGGLALQFGRKNIHLKILWPFCGFPIHKFTIIFRVCT